jgi:hypothetical protein
VARAAGARRAHDVGREPRDVDGVALATNDRVLYAVAGTSAGIYKVDTVGTGSNGVWSRVADMDESYELVAQRFIPVSEGTTYADTIWQLTTNDTMTLGATSLTFALIGVPYTSVTQFPTDRVAGRDTAGTGALEALTVGGGLEFTGSGGIQRSALTGDVTASAGSNTTDIASGVVGTTEIANGSVAYADIANLGALSVMGRSANSAGVGADISASAASGAVLRESGSTIGFGTVATAGIADDAVTNAKAANMATQTIKGRNTAGTGDPEDLSGATVLAMIDGVQAPASTDNAMARFDGAAGQIQSSPNTVEDDGRTTIDGAHADGALNLRSGDQSTGALGVWQMLFGYNDTDTYRMGIKTRHNSIGADDNVFEFYVWDQLVDTSTSVPSRLTLSLGQVENNYYSGTHYFRNGLGNLGLVEAATFTGALNGNATSATSATSATTATNATNVAITTSSDAPNHPVHFSDNASGNDNVEATAAFTYAPSSATLRITNTVTPRYRLDFTTASSFSGLTFSESSSDIASVQFIGSAFATTTRRNALELYNGHASGPVSIFTANTERVRVESDGDVGIGVSPVSGYRLSVQTGGGGATAMLVKSTGATDATGIQVGRTAADVGLNVVGAAGEYFTGSTQGDGILHTLSNTVDLHLGVGTSETPEITISNGAVGINGTANATQVKLHVQETGSSTATWRGRAVVSGANTAAVIGERNSQAWVGGHNAALTLWNDLYIQPGGTEQLYLGDSTSATETVDPILTVDNNAGKVGVNLPVATAPGASMTVNGGIAAVRNSNQTVTTGNPMVVGDRTFLTVTSAGAVAGVTVPDGVHDGQIIVIQNGGGSNIEISNSNVQTVGGASVTLDPEATLTLIYRSDSGLWYELARSLNVL